MPDSDSTVVCGLRSLRLFFASSNLVVLKLFCKDLWGLWMMLLTPEPLSAHCALAGTLFGRLLLKCYLIPMRDKID